MDRIQVSFPITDDNDDAKVFVMAIERAIAGRREWCRPRNLLGRRPKGRLSGCGIVDDPEIDGADRQEAWVGNKS